MYVSLNPRSVGREMQENRTRQRLCMCVCVQGRQSLCRLPCNDLKNIECVSRIAKLSSNTSVLASASSTALQLCIAKIAITKIFHILRNSMGHSGVLFTSVAKKTYRAGYLRLLVADISIYMYLATFVRYIRYTGIVHRVTLTY